MDVRSLLIELAEKMSLLATAGLVAVLVPPLRNRLLGVGQRRDKLAALLLGVALSLWGAKVDLHWVGENMNIRVIGIFIAGVLGGRKAGALAGFSAGMFYVYRVEPADAPWAVVASTIDGVLAGLVAHRAPQLFQGWRAFVTCCAIQGVHVVVVGLGLLVVGAASQHAPAWPAHLVKIVANAAGMTLFSVVARIIITREETAVALVRARADADAASLEALRRRLEPHFLFNALNTLRATIRKDPRRARDLVSDLADLYRYLLRHPDDARLEDEVDHACAFLAIERARLGEGSLKIETDIDPELGAVRVPALLLQPLVENAVKHGVAAHEGEGLVRIAAVKDETTMEISVEDRSQGRRRTLSEAGSGIALQTLRKRLDKRFGGRASLTLHPTPHGMRASVKLPWPGVAEPEQTAGEGRSAA
jgi:LytS/YehU family sensor histidine kinase